MITAEEKKRIEKFEKRHKTHHHIPFGVCRRIGNKRSVSDFNRDSLDTKIFQPFKQDLKWPARYICSPCKAQYAQDYHYDHELRMVRISWWWIDAHWGGAQERDWQRISTTYYIDIDTCKIFDNRFQEKSRANDYFSVWYRDNREEFRRWCSSCSLICPSGEVIEQIIEEAIKDNPALENNLYKYHKVGGECYPWEVLGLFRKVPKAPKAKPSSRDIEIQHFKEICDNDSQHEVKEGQFNGEHSVYTVEPMGLYKKLPLYLIRIYTNPYPYEYSYNKINDPHECGRLYFTRKMSTYFYRSNSMWVYEARPMLYYGIRMAGFQKNKGDIFSCASNSIRKLDITPSTLVKIVKDKRSEQAMKAGCWYLANRWIMSDNNYGYSFGPCDYSKNTIFKILRITPSQAKIIEDYVITSSESNVDNYQIIRQLKEFFGTNELSSIGNAIEKYLPYMRCLEVWGCDMEAVGNLIKKAVNISREYGFINIVRDTCRQLKTHSIDENDRFIDWKELIKDVRTLNDLFALHDRTITIANLQIAKRDKVEYERRKALEEKYKKNLKERRGYEYEDEQFLIRLPQTGLEIANEGHNLHHCVGGYVENHLKGETTILFLRKKEKPDESFYTIEVSSDGVVRQIHGACNKWLGNDPDAARFAWHWSKDKNIPCSDAIIRSVARGYSSHNADMLPESEIY